MLKPEQIRMRKYMKRKMTFWIFAICFLLMLCLLKGGQKVWAGNNVITDFSRIFYIPAGAVLRGGSLEELKETYDSMSCMAYTEDGQELELSVIWDYSGVNVQKVGAYQITGTLKLPEGYASSITIPSWTVGISVQNFEEPEIQVYSRMISAGLYYFPWITNQDPDAMEIWMQPEGEDWINISEEGYGMCDTDGMYLSCQSMVKGNTYTLTVVYPNGKTRNLKYRYASDGTLDIISYQPGLLGNSGVKDTTIRSCEPIEEGSLERLGAYALRKGQSTYGLKKQLEKSFHILGSTQTEYEDSASHPSVVLSSVWDFSGVNTAVPGVYKVTGSFQAPEGYTLDPDAKLPSASVYVTVQRPDQPQVQTCAMAGAANLFFPMVLDAFTDSQLKEFQPELKCGEQKIQLDQDGWYMTREGLYLKKENLQLNRDYSLLMTYPGGSTGIYTFHFDENFITNDHWYERNYADRDGKDLPDIDTGKETVTDVSTVIVGNRLAALMSAQVEKIPFESGGVLVRVPTEVVKDWEVGPEDEVKVDISREDGELSVSISKNGEEITDIPGATVAIPNRSGSGGRTVLTDDQGNTYTGTVNEAQNVAVIPVDKTGEYSIKEEQPQDASEDGEETGEAQSEEALEEETDTEEETADDSYETDEISGEDVEAVQDTTGDSSQDDLRKQHIKTTACVAVIVVLLILLLFLPMRKSRRLRKGDRGEGEQDR